MCKFTVSVRNMSTIFALSLILKRTDDITQRKEAFIYVNSWWKKDQLPLQQNNRQGFIAGLKNETQEH